VRTNGRGSAKRDDEDEHRYAISFSERAEAERDAIQFNMTKRSPQYGGEWLRGLDNRVFGLAKFPGPLSHPRDEEASALFEMPIRRALYYGPTNRRGKSVWRVLFTLLPPAEPNRTEIMRVLRVLHGAQPLLPPPDDANG